MGRRGRFGLESWHRNRGFHGRTSPDEKMGVHHKEPVKEWGWLPGGSWGWWESNDKGQPNSTVRGIMKKRAAKKRRQRDRKVVEGEE